jgi:hypothetical protein
MGAFGTPVLVADGTSKPLVRLRFAATGKGDLDEAWLQRLIHAHPECLPIQEIEPGFEDLISVCMELPTRHGLIDNFLVSPAGDLAIVEAKLWRNPEARRKVVAQALDYASCLFEMDYAELEAAVRRGSFAEGEAPKGIYDLVQAREARDEAQFVDAVNANLRRGRILIFVAGDGIRTEAERLVESLQSHAGFHFTLALVELAVFRLPEEGGLVVHPRTLAQTCMIDRGVVTIDDRRTSIRATAIAEPGPVDFPRNCGHPGSHEGAVGVCHGETEETSILG